MVSKGILAPKIPYRGIAGFLIWARRDNRRLYGALVARFPQVAAFEEQVKNYVDPEAGLGHMHGFADVFASIGSGLSGAASAIGRFVSNNGAALLAAGGTALVVNQQYKLANAQVQLAQAGQPPAQVAYVQTPNGPVAVPVQNTGSGYQQSYYGQPQASPSMFSSLSRIPLTTWLIGAGALGTIFLTMKRR